MHRLILLGTFCTLVTACGSGSDRQSTQDSPQEITHLQEGAGPTVNVTTEAATAERLIADIIDTIGDLFSEGLSSAFPEEEEQALFEELCSTGTVHRNIDISVALQNTDTMGITGTASGIYSGSATASTHVNLTGSFIDFHLTPSDDPPITLEGPATFTADAIVTSGADTFCKASLDNTAEDGEGDGTHTETVSGSLTIAGGYGAALTFTMTTTRPLEDDTVSETVSGSASFKSGDETITCTLSNAPSNTVSNHRINVAC